VSFEKLILSDGGEYSIRGSLANHQEEVDEEGRVKGKSTTKRDVIFIGGGAGVGAVIGAAAGGGKGAGIGAAIGAGVGVAGALLRKGYEAEVKSGTEIGMVLDQEITVAVAR
jgi:type IV secretion system protein VirB10